MQTGRAQAEPGSFPQFGIRAKGPKSLEFIEISTGEERVAQRESARNL